MIKAVVLDFYGTVMNWLPMWRDISELIINRNVLDAEAEDFAKKWIRKQRQIISTKKASYLQVVIE